MKQGPTTGVTDTHHAVSCRATPTSPPVPHSYAWLALPRGRTNWPAVMVAERVAELLRAA